MYSDYFADPDNPKVSSLVAGKTEIQRKVEELENVIFNSATISLTALTQLQILAAIKAVDQRLQSNESIVALKYKHVYGALRRQGEEALREQYILRHMRIVLCKLIVKPAAEK